MGKPTFEYAQRLTAPGNVNDWIDATEVALDFGTFEKIRLNRRGDQMRAQYGVDDIQIQFKKKNQSEVSLYIEATDEQVMNWYKACVSDVVCNPQNYSDYYACSPQNRVGDPGYKEEKKGNNKGAFFTKKWFMILMMIVLPPAGIFLFFKYHRAGIVGRVLVTAVLVFYTLFIWLGFFGLNTGFGLSSITGLVNRAATKTAPTVQQTQRSDESTDFEEPVQDYVGE